MTLLSRQDQQAPVGARAHAAPRSAATDTAVTQGGKLFGCIRVLALVAADDHKPGDRPGDDRDAACESGRRPTIFQALRECRWSRVTV